MKLSNPDHQSGIKRGYPAIADTKLRRTAQKTDHVATVTGRKNVKTKPQARYMGQTISKAREMAMRSKS